MKNTIHGRETQVRYQRGGAPRSARERGMAMLYAVFASFAAATLVAMLLSTSLTSTKIAIVKKTSARAEYLAEGAVENAKRQVLTSVAAWSNPPAAGSVTIDGVTVPYTITPTGFTTLRTDPSGIQTLVTGFLIDATGTDQATAAHIYRLVNSEATPVFQYAVFYNSDLEVNPGPSMTLGGRVHSNSDMYLNCGGTLTMNTNYVHAVGNIYRNRKDDPTASQGTVKIRNWVANPFDPAEPIAYHQMNSKSQMGSVPSTSGYDSRFTSGWDANLDGDFTDPGDYLPWAPGAPYYWSPPAGYGGGNGSSVLDHAQGTTAAVPPPVGSIKMFEPAGASGVGDYSLVGGVFVYTPGTGTHNKGFYHSKAGLSILADATHTSWKAYDSTGADITPLIPSGTVTLANIYDARQAGGSSGSTTKTKVIKIDMAKLNTCAKFPSNGLLYASCYGMGTGTNAKGVELVNGGTLKSKLTVVSEGSMYVKGDYNTIAKKGASVIADSVNLLSNAWNDTKTKGTVPAATNTTYNMAMVSGNTNTVGSSYNGGFENLPRFHENWSGKNCAITGSFVNFWLSQYATTQWGLPGVYVPPNRQWNYDTLFNNVANLPPFTPMTVVAQDVVCW
jgi:hypothetical protein